VVLGVETVVGHASNGKGTPQSVPVHETAIRSGSLDPALLLRHHHDGRWSHHNVAVRQLLDDAAAHGGPSHALAELLHDRVHVAGRCAALETCGCW